MTIVNIEVNEDMINSCYNFSHRIINGNDQFNRIPATTNERIERTFVGKLSELCFLKFLNQNNKNYPIGTMFTIFPGENNTDGYDFITRYGNYTVDVKCASKPYHRRIMVPIDQFENNPKNFYVGVRINAEIDRYDNIIIHSIRSADIYGYCTYEQLANRQTENFGYPCKAINLTELINIQSLLNLF